jgi:microcystin-dependent protein
MSNPPSWSTTSIPVPVNAGRRVYDAVTARKLEGVGMYQRHPLGETSLLVPAGSIVAFAGAVAPGGWMMCNGQDLNRQTYKNLFATIGTVYGTGDGSTTFNVPNLNGKVIVGTSSDDTEFDQLGEIGGEKTHVLTVEEMPSHNHGVTDPGHTHGVTDPGHAHSYVNQVGDQITDNNFGTETAADQVDYGQTTGMSTTGVTVNSATTGIFIQNAGGGRAHNNLQPYMALRYIIKV